MSTSTISAASENRTPGIWIETPRQPKQNRCRRNLAHSKPKRTFFWIIEAEGYICQNCVNVRETRRALQEGKLAGNSGNESVRGKTGKRSRSTKAPAVVGAVLAKRSIGENKRQIARELKISPNTVDKILDESDFDARILEGRSQAVGLIPKALGGLEMAFAKGDGSTSCRFLEGIGVLGEDKSRRGNHMPACPQTITNVLMNMPFMQGRQPNNSAEPITVAAQVSEKS